MEESDQTYAISKEDVSVCLTYKPLDAVIALRSVRSPKAGATVLFAGSFISSSAESFDI